MTQQIYFADLTHTGVGINSRAFPLGVGCVMAHANKELKGLINSSLFKFPEDLNKALLKQTPNMLCMSNFCWNINLSYTFVEYVKKINPNIITVFGGPNFPIDEGERASFLKNYPCLDFYIKWDGEYALTDLIQRYIISGLDITNLKSSNFNKGVRVSMKVSSRCSKCLFSFFSFQKHSNSEGSILRTSPGKLFLAVCQLEVFFSLTKS